jgi:hypothetical protein
MGVLALIAELFLDACRAGIGGEPLTYPSLGGGWICWFR